MVLLTATQGSPPSGRYFPGTPPAQRPGIPGTSTWPLRVEACFYLPVRTSTLDVERPDLRLASHAKRLRQRLRGVSRFYRRRTGLLFLRYHRHDQEFPQHRETVGRDPGPHWTAFDQMRGLQSDRGPGFFTCRRLPC